LLCIFSNFIHPVLQYKDNLIVKKIFHTDMKILSRCNIEQL